MPWCQQGSPFLAITAAGLGKSAHLPRACSGGPPAPELTEKAGGAVSLISLHRLSFGFFWVGRSFACFGRGVLLWGFCVRPWVFGLILGVVGGPRAVSLTGWDGEKVAFLSYSCGEVGWVCILHSSSPQAEVASFGFHCVDSTGAGQRDFRREKPQPWTWQSRHAALSVLVPPRQGRTLPREEDGVQERNSVHSPARAGPKASHVGSGEVVVASPWAEGTPLGRHHQPSRGLQATPEKMTIPGPGANPGFPRGSAPVKREGRT